MSELKEYPTQEEYDANPEYFRDFERRLEEERDRILLIIQGADEADDLVTLENQLLGTGITQAQIKQACLVGYGPDGKAYPLWQKIEMFDMAVMYHDILRKIDEIFTGRSLENV